MKIKRYFHLYLGQGVILGCLYYIGEAPSSTSYTSAGTLLSTSTEPRAIKFPDPSCSFLTSEVPKIMHKAYQQYAL